MKRGISELVATVLLILLTITAASLIYGFVSPLIKDVMAETELCRNAEISVLEGTCYNPSSNEINAEIGVGENTVISGISIVISGRDTASSVVIKNGTVSGVKEYNSAYGTALTLPGQNEARTYVINAAAINATSPSGITAYPLVSIKNKDRVCKSYAQASLKEC